MSVATDMHEPHRGPWTIADVEALPEDGNRYEIVSVGVLMMSPAPGLPHQGVSLDMAMSLVAATKQFQPSFRVYEAINVELPGGKLAIPDVVVVDRAAAKRASTRLQAQDVLLAVEIVSPGSKPIDRAIKPDLYAEAGIPWFWLCELEPTPYLNVYELRGDAYELTETIRQRTELTKPFKVIIDPVSWLD